MNNPSIYEKAVQLLNQKSIDLYSKIMMHDFLSQVEEKIGKVSAEKAEEFLRRDIQKIKSQNDNNLYILFCSEFNYLNIYMRKHKTELKEIDSLEDKVINTLKQLTDDDLSQIREIKTFDINEDGSLKGLSILLWNDKYMHNTDVNDLGSYPFLTFGLIPYDNNMEKYYV